MNLENIIIVPNICGNVKLFNMCSKDETLLQEYLFTERKTNVYNVAAAINLLSHEEHRLKRNILY